jgi:putative inorganic carbon (hco3(-)) transporter
MLKLNKITSANLNKEYSLPEKLKIPLVYLITSLFLMMSVYMVIRDMYWAAFIPIGIIIFLLYLYSFDLIFWLVVLATPLAVNIRDFDLGFGISLPTEPLLLGILILFIIKLLFDRIIDRRFLKHPITIAIIINLIWILITSITSELPLVSFKFFVARLWFVIPMYFVGFMLFKKIGNAKLFSWLYVASLLIVIGYTIYNHSLYAFNEEQGHWVMSPFYNDHTAYGAVLALFIPIMFGFGLDKSNSRNLRILAITIFGVLLLALFLSYSRAAWLSLVLAIVIYVIILLKIRLRWIIASIVLFLVFFMTFKFEILDRLNKNKQDSSSNVIEHIESIANISSDPSNLERVNRWQSALRLFSERPVFGWGPGTYQFEYAPFQRSKEKTIISTNAGDRGNSHSEYIGPLAESGLMGMLTFMAIIVLIIWTGIRSYKRAESKQVKILSLVTVLSFVTYALHGLMNNFLDSDKASVPFWGFAAIIVAIDIYHCQADKTKVLNRGEESVGPEE